MAGADYRSCDVCGGKAFYDADLSYDTGEKIDGSWICTPEPYKVAGEDQGAYSVGLGNLGDWAVICKNCAKTHKTAIVKIKAIKNSCK